MNGEEFARIVGRLEHQSAASPRRYRAKVAALALLGFAILALLFGAMGFGLVILAGIAAALALYGGAAVVLLVLKLGKILLLFAIPIWYLGKSAIKALLIRLPAPEGREIACAEAPALFAEIERMRAKMKGPRFHHVLVTGDVNAAIVQRPAFGLVGWPRNYLVLGLPLLECMAPDEALAVVAHEYGHLAGAHGRFSAFIYRLRHTWGTVQAFAQHVQGWLGRLVTPVIRWYVPYFNAYTFVLARAEEYQADAAAATLVGRTEAAHALKRTNVIVPRHQRFMASVYARIDHESEPPADIRQRWADHTRLPAADGDVRRWLVDALDRAGDPTDSHPTLRARLTALSCDSGSLTEPPPPLERESAAQAWLGATVEALRTELQAAWARQTSGPWAELHGEAQKLKRRLEELRAVQHPDVDQRIEVFRLMLRLESEVDLREALAEFNHDHHDHAAGLFYEGVVRLDRGDRAGLALLDRVIRLDPELIKPACERAHAFLVEQEDGLAAESYSARWRERDGVEVRREKEVRFVDPKHSIESSTLSTDQVKWVKARMLNESIGFLKAAYLARRIIPADPDLIRLSMGLKFTWVGRRLGRQRSALKRLLAMDWPFTIEFVLLEGEHSSMEKKFKAIDGAKVF